ncbi:hypothetical protein GZB42_001618 [Salmonella enterica]|nr:hypothetical protein [Salmonella enterica]EEL0428627.1 hypothetical protein [Salmonella enterica]ELF1575946.1 hypothetical protein [Salmonella enterica]
MGLDVYFIKRPADTTADTTRREQDEAVGYYRKFNALLNWIDANAGEVENCTDVPLTRHDLEKLRATLDRLTPENCHDLFPTTEGFFFGSQDYNDDYWSDVENLKQFVQQQLASFDFDAHRLCFHAWW